MPLDPIDLNPVEPTPVVTERQQQRREMGRRLALLTDLLRGGYYLRGDDKDEELPGEGPGRTFILAGAVPEWMSRGTLDDGSRVVYVPAGAPLPVLPRGCERLTPSFGDLTEKRVAELAKLPPHEAQLALHGALDLGDFDNWAPRIADTAVVIRSPVHAVLKYTYDFSESKDPLSLSASWVDQVASDYLYSSGSYGGNKLNAGGIVINYRNSDYTPGSADYSVELIVTDTTPGHNTIICVSGRIVDSSNNYYAYLSPKAAGYERLRKRVAGTPATLAERAFTTGGTYTCRLQMEGASPSITLYYFRDGANDLYVTGETDFSNAGTAGLFGAVQGPADAETFDDFKCYEPGVAAAHFMHYQRMRR